MKNEAGKSTISEILSEPRVWRRCLDELDRTETLEAINRKFSGEVEYVFVGCGSSFYLAQAAAATWSLVTRSSARALPASEIVLFPKLLPVACQPVLISRSGFTSEVLDAAEYLEQRRRIRTLAVTCGSNTPLEKIAAYTICLHAADERSTVMTRSYTSMLLALQSLAGLRARDTGFLRALRELPEKAEAILPTQPHCPIPRRFAHLRRLRLPRPRTLLRCGAGSDAQS